MIHDKMRFTREKYLLGAAIVVTQAISIAHANIPIVRNGCVYPACINTNGQPHRCVHDSSFCKPGELFMTAKALQEGFGNYKCTCRDILSFPQSIGTCLTSVGHLIPMLVDEDCVGGTPQCPANDDGKYIEADDSTSTFTACDLECNIEVGHDIEVLDDTYKGCYFPKFHWTVASKSEFSSMHGNGYGVVDDTLYIGGNVQSLKTCYIGGEFTSSDSCPLSKESTTSYPPDRKYVLNGPFTANNPTSLQGTFTNDVEYSDDMACSIGFVNKHTGQPTRDFFTINNRENCNIITMAVGGTEEGINKKVIVAGGYHNAGGIFSIPTATCTPVDRDRAGGASTTCEDGVTTIYAQDDEITTFVLSMAPHDNVNWVIQPWLVTPEFQQDVRQSSSYITSSSVDKRGNVYICGARRERTSQAIYAMISKLSAADGSLLWEKELAGVGDSIRLVEDASAGAIYVSLQIETGPREVFGITCTPPGEGQGEKMCNILARVSEDDGSVQWARFTYGFSDPISIPRFKNGEVRLAHRDDGPYVYASFYGGEDPKSTTLDNGTPYSGCKKMDGHIKRVKIEVDPIFSNRTSPLDDDGCNMKSAGAYFSRESEDAIPTDLQNTNARCDWTETGQYCLVKYHKLTGLPIWGSVTPRIKDFQPLADGIVMTGFNDKGVPSKFGTVEISLEASQQSMVFQSKVDLDGRGIYVQPIIAHNSDATHAQLAHDSDTGDVYIGFLTDASKTHLGVGESVGFVQDLEINNDQYGNDVSRLTVAKLGGALKASCIATCESSVVIKTGRCFIDQVCYEESDNGARIGKPCYICDPSKSQTSWTLPQPPSTSCTIDNKCYKDGDYLYVNDKKSECQICNSEDNPTGWSLKTGYTGTFGSPPLDCIKKGSPTPVPTDKPLGELMPISDNDGDDYDDDEDDDDDGYDIDDFVSPKKTVTENDAKTVDDDSSRQSKFLPVPTFVLVLIIVVPASLFIGLIIYKTSRKGYDLAPGAPAFFPAEGDIA
eukprot:CAMPEP_0198261764 /NCGR_PEP_ID=MMETSP1447-20131203/10424_1 /TAXON_ID=420782 /ORGANISM="Chaetoceros dichaeta, Strain CCMP1751" /LENGTH=999 /DNA_ID=CAMNT_0043949781 /DNA_START=31 /DNA_END=3030 /DNA_ORIENTATION=+